MTQRDVTPQTERMPETQAGRALIEAVASDTLLGSPRGYVFAIEQEARAEFRASLAEKVAAISLDDFGENYGGGFAADQYRLAVLAALIEGTDPASPEPHRHRYGLTPVWTKDGSEVESWWWCTDHPAGEWVKIEDDPDAAYAIPKATPVAGSTTPPLDVLTQALADTLAVNHAHIQHEISGYDMPVGGIARALAARLAESPVTGEGQ